MIKFHKEGYTSLALCLLLIFVSNAILHYYLPETRWLIWLWYAFSALIFIVIVQFFRSPQRKWITNDNLIVCPADGKVVVLEEVYEPEFLKTQCIQVSIFMSPINVHVNRNPVSGIVKYFKYHPGKYLVAWHPKSSTENERTTTVVETKNGTQILYRQIAGALARRIVWYLKENDNVSQSQQFGFIKFGSRVDIFVPLKTEINVTLKQVVKGGVTVLATI